MRFYYQYLATWPEYFKVQEAPSGRIMGYGWYIFFLHVKDQDKKFSLPIPCKSWESLRGNKNYGMDMLLLLRWPPNLEGLASRAY